MYPLICVKLKGGLGNQLFQYAAARALAYKTGRVIIDTTYYNKDYSVRNLGVNCFKIKASVLPKNLITKIFKNGSRLNLLLSSLGLFSSIKEEVFKVNTNLINRLGFLTHIEGYWQSSDYFEHLRPILLKELEPKHMPSLPAFIDSRTIAVHVRRTDYLKDDRYGFIGTEYYTRAMQYLSQKIHSAKFVIFSDDINWCKSYFKGENILFFDEPEWKEDYLQLYLMAQCPYQIIANSSFSWWSAWLNQHPEKIIVRPLTPFNDPSLLYENYYPINWIPL
ncbi:MAG: hypothetical protein RJB03_1656 [Bacteroidota bacterium]|jgi:hypothetical protein